MFGWHLMSLKSAEMAGLNLPASVRQRMQAFLKLVAQGDHGGLYGYRRNVVTNGQNSERVTPAMTAEALFCHQMLGNDPNSAATRVSIRAAPASCSFLASAALTTLMPANVSGVSAAKVGMTALAVNKSDKANFKYSRFIMDLFLIKSNG